MRHFTSIRDVADPLDLVRKAQEFKRNQFQPDLARGKTVGLIFMNPSLRTRLSSIKAIQNLGAQAIVLDVTKDGWALEFGEGVVMNSNKAEHIQEAAAVMGAYFDVLAIRTFPGLSDKATDYGEKVINAFLKHSKVPIVSLESGTRHPLQGLTDLMTINEQWDSQRRPKVVMSWAPHLKALPQAVPNTFAEWMNAAPVDFVITHPVGYELEKEFTQNAKVFHDQQQALEGADFVYVKNWSSVEPYGQVLTEDPTWRFSMKHLDLTNQAKVMHCLPVRRGVVIDDEVLECDQAIHIQQAANRVFAAQAVFNELLK
jgi:N-succinyl-L-ornithine transcarbamylase